MVRSMKSSRNIDETPIVRGISARTPIAWGTSARTPIAWGTSARTPMPRFSWKWAGSALATAIILAGLLWNILACTESPMAFSPDGKNLIFSMMQPYEEKGGDGGGPGVCRLMALADAGTPNAKNMRALEELPGGFITGPGFSADGKQFCYLRIRAESTETGPATQAASAPAAQAEVVSLRLPGEADPVNIASHEVVKAGDMGEVAAGQALLVVRETASFKVLSAALVDFTMGTHDEAGHPYLTLRPQYGADGSVIFYADHAGVHAVNLKEKSAAVIGRRAMCPVMSPDRKTLAFVGAKDGNSVVMLATDLSGLTEQFLPRAASLSGLFWVNNNTLAVLTMGEDKKAAQQIVMYGRDGKALSKVELPAFEGAKDDAMGELAIAPDGKSIVVCYNAVVRFFDAAGKLQHEVTLKEDTMLAQPTFTPDGKRVAFKELKATKAGEKETTQVANIVFYDLEGKEVARVAVPAASRLP